MTSEHDNALLVSICMRLLACSDIHNNVHAVHRLRSQERNTFDAVLVAGDLGWETATETLDILDSFSCPVYFVYGNWDNRLGYFSLDQAQRRQVHLNVFDLGGIYVTGFSGCPASWGKNPQAQALMQKVYTDSKPLFKALGRFKAEVSPIEMARYEQARTIARKDALSINRAKLTEILVENPERTWRTIVLTHERLFKLNEMGSPLMHLHGHVHTYKHSFHKGSHILDVACLDPGSSAFRSNRQAHGPVECGYSIITIGKELTITTERKALSKAG